MQDKLTDRDPLEELATQFVDRYRSGESPTIEEYTHQYPELAEQILDLFPTIAAMENLKVRKEESTPGSFMALHNLQRLGDYRLIREIGRGGMGVVYEAEQESLGRRVAVKILPRQSLLDEKGLQRFKREAQTAAKLHHTNIVPIFGVGEQEGHHYFVMQLIQGVSLDQIVGELRQGVGSDLTANGPRSAGGPGVREVARAIVDDSFESLSAATDQSSSSRSSFSNAAVVDTALTSGSTGVEDSLAAAAKAAQPLESVVPAAEPDADATDDHIPGLHTASDELDLSSGRIDLNAAADQPAGLQPREMSHLGASFWRGVARIGSQAASALEYAHAHGTLHRDVKPGNLLLDGQGVVWVADFGLAKAVENDNVSHSGDVVGTLRYMAPEQFEGTTDHRSDIYALGLTLYELVALRPAYNESLRPGLIRQIQERSPDSPRKNNPNIPRDLETIVLKAISHNPADRYQTAADLDYDLQAFLEDRPIRARRLNPIARVWRWCRRNQAVAALSATATLLLVAVALVASVGFIQTKRALGGETEQRLKAESTAALALEALESIYRQFEPSGLRTENELTVEGQSGQAIQLTVQPVLSREVAIMLENMLVFYDRLAEKMGSADEPLQKSAEANRRVGEIRYRLGEFNDAESAFLKSIALYESFDNEKYAATIASLHNRLGDVHRRRRDNKAAKRSHETALRILETANMTNSAAEVRFELARTYYNLVARIPETGGQGEPRMRGFGPRFGGRSRGQGRGRGIERRGGSRGSRTRGQRGPGSGTKDQKGDSETASQRRKALREQVQQATEYKEKAVALLESLVEEHPQVPDYKHLLARCHRDMRSFSLGGAPDVGKATQLLRELVSEFPDVADYQFDLATTLIRQSGSRWSASEEDKKRLNEAVEIGETLVQKHPNIPDYARGLAISLDRLGRYFEQRRNHTQATIQWTAARSVYDTLSQRYPEAVNYHAERAWIGLTLARLYADEGETAAAVADLEKLVASLRTHDNVEDEPWLLTMPLFRIHGELAILYSGNDLTKSNQHHEESTKSLRAFEKGAKKNGFNPLFGPPRRSPSISSGKKSAKANSAKAKSQE